MEECAKQDIPSLILTIKNEPKEEVEDLETHRPDYHITRSLILRFIKDQKGCYSVVPHIKPDPFFEEHLEDLYSEEFKIKSEEQENLLNYEDNEHFDIKQEKVDIEDKYSTNEANSIVTGINIKENNEPKKKSPIICHCPNCLYSNTRARVKRHMQRVHVSITKHSCPFCDKKNFKEPLSLDSHILKKHTDINGAIDCIKRTIFKCTFCTYKTLKRNNFRRHLTTHGEGRLKRELKLKGDKRNLVEFHSKHEMEKALSITKYDCFHCSYTTKDKGSIIKHLRLHRGATQLPFSCKGCNKKFNEKNSLDSHIVKRHIKNPELLQLITNRVYECEMCNYKDVNKNKVKRHKKARHVKKEKKKRKIRERRVRLGIVKK